MFYYFGRKARTARSYDAPEYPLVVEPFAGSMAYTLAWRPAMAIGIERDEQTVALWHRLCEMSKDDIREFPPPTVGSSTRDRWVITAAASASNHAVKNRTVNDFIVGHFEHQRRYALKHHTYARRSVLYHHGDYQEAPDVEATWFIDPPYQGVEQGYRHNDISYAELAEWCMTRRGQVIVCEGPYADWLRFEHHSTWQGNAGNGRNGKPRVEKVLMRRTSARCAQCDVMFPASRSDARYCSARCRQRASRSQRSHSPPA